MSYLYNQGKYAVYSDHTIDSTYPLMMHAVSWHGNLLELYQGQCIALMMLLTFIDVVKYN